MRRTALAQLLYCNKYHFGRRSLTFFSGLSFFAVAVVAGHVGAQCWDDHYDVAVSSPVMLLSAVIVNCPHGNGTPATVSGCPSVLASLRLLGCFRSLSLQSLDLVNIYLFIIYTTDMRTFIDVYLRAGFGVTARRPTDIWAFQVRRLNTNDTN